MQDYCVCRISPRCSQSVRMGIITQFSAYKRHTTLRSYGVHCTVCVSPLRGAAENDSVRCLSCGLVSTLGGD